MNCNRRLKKATILSLPVIQTKKTFLYKYNQLFQQNPLQYMCKDVFFKWNTLSYVRYV